jgi:ribosomal protein S18 acetylase RimI-like enzyme
LVQLPGEYVAPRGRLLLALTDKHVAGVIAFRPTDDQDTCEMKRLFVHPTSRGQGVGRALIEKLVEEARKSGYRSMRLETLHAMKKAQTLYNSFGFVLIDTKQDTILMSRSIE